MKKLEAILKKTRKLRAEYFILQDQLETSSEKFKSQCKKAHLKEMSVFVGNVGTEIQQQVKNIELLIELNK